MKTLKSLSLWVFLLVFPLAFFACSGSDDPEPDPDPNILRLDGDNFSAPIFPANVSHETAMQFPATMVDPYVGRSLNSVEVFIGDIPDFMEIRVYEEGNANNPGDLLLSQEVQVSGENGRFKTFALSNPPTIPEGDLWISVVVESSFEGQIIGCDPGPAVSGGDWYVEGSGPFRTFRSFTQGEVNINWNIRGVVGN